MTLSTRRSAGMLLVIFPTVIYGGVSLLRLLTTDPSYAGNPLRQDLFRAGHAHAGVILILSLVALLYLDHARLGERARSFVRWGVPTAAILLPAGFFFSVLFPDATTANACITLAYAGAVELAAALVVLGIGLLRRPSRTDPPD